MHPNQIPEKPLIAGVGKLEEASRVYFFERENGTIFFAQGQEAWNIYKGRVQILGQDRPRYKFLGSSDGTKFRQGVLEAQKIMRDKGLVEAQERIRQAEQEELESARGHKITPPNYDTVTKGNVPINLANLGK